EEVEQAVQPEPEPPERVAGERGQAQDQGHGAAGHDQRVAQIEVKPAGAPHGDEVCEVEGGGRQEGGAEDLPRGLEGGEEGDGERPEDGGGIEDEQDLGKDPHGRRRRSLHSSSSRRRSSSAPRPAPVPTIRKRSALMAAPSPTLEVALSTLPKAVR